MFGRRGIFPILLVFAAVGLLGSLLLHLNSVDKQQQQYKQHTAMLDISYRAALHTYRIATEIYLRDTIRQPDVLALFARAWQADLTEKARLRHRLYVRLLGSYQELWQYRLRQLHFHLPDGESFLRFHQPDRFGDKLFSVRPSVRIANTELHDVAGFEAGRIIDGFRYVTPLRYHGQHIGSVETSIPFKSVQMAMTEYAADREYQFMVHADLIQERLFPDYRSVYTPSPLSDAYLIENPGRKHPDTAVPLSTTATAIAARLRRDSEIMQRMARSEAFSVGLIQAGSGYVVSFLPVKEVTGGKGGYLISYVKEPLVTTIKRSFVFELVGFACLLGFSFWLLLRWRGSLAQLAEQSAKQQYEELLLTQQEAIEHGERTRISRELHDGIGQALHAVLLRLKLLLGTTGPDRSAERLAIGELIRDIQNASAELRNLVISLRPLPLSGMKIDEAVQWLCRNLEKDGGVSLLLQTAGDFDNVSDQCSLVLFRVCQEGLTNILKHAAAKRVQVSLQRQDATVVLTICDDGSGGAQPSDTGGSGLAIMRERVDLAGGRLVIESPAGQGTRIFVELPCH